MRLSDRAARLTAQIALLVTLASLSVFLLANTYLGDPEHNYEEGAIHEQVARGPVTVENVRWQVESVQPYAYLADEEKRRITLAGNVAGSAVVVVNLTVTPLDGVRLSDGGFPCDASLRDDRGNVWNSQDVSGHPTPTGCNDSDHPFTLNRPGKIAKVYVVPASAVPHLVGISVGSFREYRRVLITF